VSALEQALKRSKDADQKTRIRAIISIKKGETRTATAERFVVSRTSVVSWIAAYNKGGVDALAMGRGGRSEGNPKWDASVFEALARAIDTGGYWSIPRMQEWLKKHQGKDIPEQTVWYRLDRLGYSYKSARPHPVQGNTEAQTAFKKGALSRSWNR
jgi:transposase